MITSPCSSWTSAFVLGCFGTGWLTQPCFILCFSSCFALSRSQSYALLACRWLCSSCLPLAMLFCLLLALLFSVLYILSPLLDDERCSASASSLRCSSRCPRTRVALLRSSVVLSLILSRDTFVVVYSFLDASPAPPTPPLSIAPFVIVGSRLVLRLLHRVVCSADCEDWSERFVAAAVRRWFPMPLCDPLVSTLKMKAFIAASWRGVVRRFVRHRWRVLDPRVSLSSGFSHCHCHCHTLLPFTCAPDFLSCISRGSELC